MRHPTSVGKGSSADDCPLSVAVPVTLLHCFVVGDTFSSGDRALFWSPSFAEKRAFAVYFNLQNKQTRTNTMDQDAMANPAKTASPEVVEAAGQELNNALVLSPGVTLTLGPESLLIPGRPALLMKLLGTWELSKVDTGADQLVTKPNRSCLPSLGTDR